MLKSTFTILILLLICQIANAQNIRDIQSNFEFYELTEFTDGMKFMVEPDGYHINHNFKTYHKKGRGTEIDLNKIKGQIFEFKRYETREMKCSKGECPILFLIFEQDGNEFEYNTYKSKEELEKQSGDLKQNVEEFIFYEDVLIAEQVLKNKEFYLTKSLGYNFRGTDKLYKITDINAKSSDFPIEIEYTDVASGSKYKQEFRLSGTNERHVCKSYANGCSFSEYFMNKEQYEQKKKREKDLIVAYRSFKLKSKPENFASEIMDIKDGDTLKYLGYSNDYYIVEKDGKKGYVEKYSASFYLKDEMKRERDSIIKMEREIKSEKLEDKILNDCNYYKNEVDEFNGQTKIFTDVYNLMNKSLSIGEFSVELRKVDNSRYIWFHSSQDLGCASSYENNKSYVKIKLENDDILTFYHIGDVDCGDFSLFARLSQSDIARLKKSPIKTVRLSGTDYYHDIDSIEWNTFFADKLECIK